MPRTTTVLKRIMSSALRQTWRTIVLVIGTTVVLVGVALIVLPGPAFIVIPAGLAILALEFAWARNLLVRAREGAMKVKDRIRSNDQK